MSEEELNRIVQEAVNARARIATDLTPAPAPNSAISTQEGLPPETPDAPDANVAEDTAPQSAAQSLEGDDVDNILASMGVDISENPASEETTIGVFDINNERWESANQEYVESNTPLRQSIEHPINEEEAASNAREDNDTTESIPMRGGIDSGVDFEEISGPTPEELSDATSRFRGADWFERVQQERITLAGLGGIGSWAAFLLARLHPDRIALYDADTIESANLSGQLYGRSEIGANKARALAQIISNDCDYYDFTTHAEFFDENSAPSSVMISGFDNMAARQLYYNKWKGFVDSCTNRKECLFIDARMSAENIQIFCMTGNDIAYMQEYERDWLFSDEEADNVVCSYKQTSFCAAIIGGLITNLFVNFCENLRQPIIDRPLPFITTYDATTMFMNVKC